MTRPPPLFSPAELAAILLEAASEVRGGLPAAREVLAAGGPVEAGGLLPLRRLFHNVAGVMPSLGLRELGFLGRTGEALVRLLPDHPALRPLGEELLNEVAALVFELHETPLPPPGPAPVAAAPAPEHEAARTVLVVDDDPASTLQVQVALASLGLRVIVCNSSEKAIALLDEEQPDLAILDVLMPGVDGFELCRRIRLRSTQRYMPILFLSAATATEERVRGLSVGGDDFLPKPFAPQELRARVQTHLQRVATMRELSIRDALTHVYNRGYFDERLAYETRRSRRAQSPFTLVMLDIDHFKKVNDRYGHQAGDAALIHCSQLLSAQFRGTDLIFRYGGEEFAVILVGTEGEAARLTVERACAAVARAPVRYAAESTAPVEILLTLSAGLSTSRDADSPEGLIGRADRALFAAKDGGRNRVCADEPTEPAHG